MYYGETADNTEDSKDTGDELPPEAYPPHGFSVKFNNTGDVWKDLAPWKCNLCSIPQTFGNSDELADHGADFHGVDPRSSAHSSAQKYIKKQWDLDQHARDNVYNFAPPSGSQGYATTKATVFKETNLGACIDTGSGASVIDRSLLPAQLYGVIRQAEPVTLKGVCALQIRNEIARFQIPLGEDGEINVAMEAYVVDNLQAGLIIGLGQLERLDAVLHLRRHIMAIGDKEVKAHLFRWCKFKHLVHAYRSLDAYLYCG